MSDGLQASAQRVQEFLAAQGHTGSVVALPDSARTAVAAATALGCEVAHIANSLIFRGQTTDRSILVLTSGANRVDLERIGALAGEEVGKANAAFVRAKTGFAIGGVPPVAHASPPLIFIDEDLFQYEQIWAAAGTPHTVFPMTPADLVRFTAGRVATVKEGA